MLNEEKIWIHFGANGFDVYTLKNSVLKLISRKKIVLETSATIEELSNAIDLFLSKFSKEFGVMDNYRVRLYATGVFQKFSQLDQDKLVISVFVNHGLYLNIIPPDLEQFYAEKSQLIDGTTNIIQGLYHQEFRQVVICGSFQQYLKEIGIVMSILQKRNVSVLSPWTTKIVPETKGTNFILLEGQEPLKNHRDAWKHKYIHMNKFRHSDAIIVCNPDGVIGKGTMFEFGFMVALSKRIIFTETPRELSIPFPYEIGLNFK